MVKIQIDLTNEENRRLEIFKAEEGIETKELALKETIKRVGKCKHKYDLVEKYTIGTQPQTWKKHIIQRCVYCGELKKEII